MVGTNSLVIMTARSNEVPDTLDDATRHDMEKFNIATVLDNATNFSYISIFGGDANRFYQTMNKQQVSYRATKGESLGDATVPADIKVLIDNNYENSRMFILGD